MIIQLASCVMVDDYGRILLLHRNANGLVQWELPGSVIGPDESATEAVVRGIKHTLGMSVELVRPLGLDAYEVDEQEYHSAWLQAIVTEADPRLSETTLFDDLDYFELEDLPSLALSADMLVLQEKIISGEVALEA